MWQKAVSRQSVRDGTGVGLNEESAQRPVSCEAVLQKATRESTSGAPNHAETNESLRTSSCRSGWSVLADFRSCILCVIAGSGDLHQGAFENSINCVPIYQFCSRLLRYFESRKLILLLAVLHPGALYIHPCVCLGAWKKAGHTSHRA
jgi:hypothetical protein